MQERVIDGIVLAAGSATRFGSDKRRHSLGGKPLLNHCIEACLASRLPRVTLVLGPERDDHGVAAALPADGRLRVIRNPEPERGQMSSLKTALAQLSGETDAAMVLLGDMPFVTPEIIDRLIATFEDTNAIVIPEKDGVQRHPRVMPARFFPHFMRLGDDERGSRLIEEFAADVVVVDAGEAHNYRDIDSVEDLEH